ncbi:MAG: type II toxin-antitoxin system HicB family antitoxin [Deltaproteobacteria bacterium]|nr:type II toxin-antitoxin system HicB family antitoxin [Deltaproteobacteria bacterium]
MEYTLKIFPDPEGDGDYIAEIEELKGCTAFGETPEEALKEIEVAMKLWIETAKKHGKPIPKPKKQIVNEPKKRFNVIFPASLLNDVDEYRGKYGMKRSELLAAAAEEFISSQH